MKKYNISKEYGIFAKFTTPYNKVIFPLGNLFLSICPLLVKSDEYVKITKTKIGKNNLKLYIFKPIKTKTDKILLYIHGGAFTYKGFLSHYKLCKRFAKDAGLTVVYIDYRLAPKYKYPSALNDCLYAYNWIIQNKDTLHVDKHKIIVAGDSAGGCLTAELALKTIENNLIKPYYLMLFYPLVNKKLNTNSMKEYTNTPMWNSKLTKKMWKYYLKDNNYTAPNESKDLDKMPPIYIETAEYDSLHDEDVLFAKKLKEQGVNVTLYETKNTMHGYDTKDCSITEKVIQNRIKILKKL